MSDLPDQRERIRERDWDYLLVLDACRYDAFEALHGEYVDGELDRVRSPGSQTIEWLSETFPDEYPEITYVSGHAIVNSDGIRANDPTREQVDESPRGDPDYTPAEHFPDIVDAWKGGYDQDIETVDPRAVNEELEAAEPPAIGHYPQPHMPWARGNDYIDTEYPRREKLAPRPDESSHTPRFSRGRILHHLGEDWLAFAYRDNLEFVLEHVAPTRANLDGTVVITSDHGELLTGPDAHPAGRDDPALREVPWMVVE